MKSADDIQMGLKHLLLLASYQGGYIIGFNTVIFSPWLICLEPENLCLKSCKSDPAAKFLGIAFSGMFYTSVMPAIP